MTKIGEMEALFSSIPENQGCWGKDCHHSIRYDPDPGDQGNDDYNEWNWTISASEILEKVGFQTTIVDYETDSSYE